MLPTGRAGREHVLLTRWGRVAALSVDQLVAWGVLYYAYPVLAPAIAADVGVTALAVAAAFSLTLLTAGWSARWVGPAMDRRGTRGALRLGAFLAAPCFASLALVRGEVSLFAVFVALGVVHALTLYEPVFRAIVDWYPEERRRTRALLAVTIVAGFASTGALPLTNWLTGEVGWRSTVAVLAAALAVTLIPIRLALPFSSRGGRAPSTSEPPPALRSSKRLAIGLALQTFASTGVGLYLMWLLVERQLTPATAAAVAGLAGAAQIPGRLAFGPLRRRLGPTACLPILVGGQAVAIAAVVLSSGTSAIMAVLAFGALNGMMTLERASVLLDWYGAATFGARQGRLAAATSTARAVAPFAVAGAHRLASYRLVFAALAVTLTAAAWVCRTAARAREAE